MKRFITWRYEAHNELHNVGVMHFIMHFITHNALHNESQSAAKRRYMSLHAELPASSSLPACARCLTAAVGSASGPPPRTRSCVTYTLPAEKITQAGSRSTRESAGMIVARAVLATQHGHAQFSPGSRTVQYHENERVALPTLTCRCALVDKFFLSAHKCKVGARQLSAARSASSRAGGSAAE